MPEQDDSAAAFVEHLFYPGVLAGSLLLGLTLIEAGVAPSVVLASNGLLFALLCFATERRFGAADAWRLDPVEARADVLHALISNPIPSALLRVTLSTSVVAASAWAAKRIGFPLWPTHWPILAQFVLALLAVELVSYAVHRALHGRPLWPLHAVHHCSPRMYFLLSVRKHPLQSLVTYGSRLVFVWLLGIPTDTLTLLLVFTTAHSYVQHANVRMNTRPWSRVFATPELHRLHHSRRESELNANFGDVLIVWDRVFGTRVEPRLDDDLSDAIGLPGLEVSQSYGTHLLLPFRWSRLHRAAAAGGPSGSS